MLRILRRTERLTTDHEELFLERYDRLHDRALRLTRDREQAADLVQDAFVQWTLKRTPLEDIRNVDAYLFTMVGHLHVSQVRRAVRARQVPLDLLEHDSAEFALKGIDAAGRLQASEELRLLCEYACNRRLSSRTGSVLLLRFFHGYYTREISGVLRLPAANVDGFLHLARREARACLSDSRTVAASGACQSTSLPRPASSSRDDCLRDLRASMFALAHDRCYSDEWLADTYSAASADVPPCAAIAEIVTCPRCLDAVNRILGLPLLADRYPTDFLGPDHRSGPDGGGHGTGGQGGAASRLRRRATDVFEHRPSELSIVANGFFVASHRIAGPRSEQAVRLNIGEPVTFIEVFSEQQVRLALAAVQTPPDGQVEQTTVVALSDDRSLELAFDYAEAQPVLRVRYCDPSFRAAATVDGVIEAQPPTSPELVSDRQPSSDTDQSLWPRLRAFFPVLVLRPLAIPVALACLLLLWWLHTAVAPPRMSASELLARATAADAASLRTYSGVQHRVFDVEQRRFGDQVVLERTRLELWRRGGDLAVARRAYDFTSGTLEAVEIEPAGKPATLYTPGERPRQLSGTHAETEASVAAGELWRFEPSVPHFRELTRGLPDPVLEETSPGYVLRTEAAPSQRIERGVVRVMLTLARDGLRPINQAVWVKGPRGSREYRFSERLLERLPAAGADRFFLPEPDLLAPPSDVASGGRPAAPSTPLSAEDAAGLQIEALYLLNLARATQGEQVSVTPGGRGIRIEGIVDSSRRRLDILSWLAPIAASPFVTIQLQTIDEAVRSRGTLGTPGITRGVEARDDRIRGYADVRRYLMEHSSDTWPLEPVAREQRIEQEVNRFGAEVLDRSRLALQRAWALQRLVDQVPPELANGLASGTREKWRSMVREHARAVRDDVAGLRQTLLPIFKPALAGAPEGQAEMLATGSIREAAATLLALASAQEEAVRSSFALSTTETRSATTVTSSTFWESLRRAERLAGSLANVD